jgi:hypothetical protein
VIFRTPVAAALGLAAAAMLTLTAEAQAQRRAGVRVGVGVAVARPRVYVSTYRYRPAYYAYDPWFYDSWYYPYGYYYPYSYAQVYPRYPYRYDDSASMRLQVSPRQTEVFVDGYFAGSVDDFDGVLQRLHLEPGDHEIQLFLPGHRPHVQRVYLQPTRTFTIRHTMVPLGAGEAEPARPSGEPLPRRDEDYPQTRRAPGPRDREPGPPRDRDPQAPARADAAAGFGSLALRVQPADADVLIDGERWQGNSDERLVVQLGSGVHRVEIRKEGYRTYMTEITVRPGETAALNVAMTRTDR